MLASLRSRCLIALFVAAAHTAHASAVMLTGAGATFPEPLYKKWLRTFEEGHPGVSIAYEATGSGAGVERLKRGSVDFAASDAPLSEKEIAEFSRPILQLPSVAGAVVPIYNLPRITRDIRFTPEVLTKIYLGQIRKWNDPAIKASNRDVALPDQEISVIHRQDGSGTTFIWTGYLANSSSEWKSRFGSGFTVAWPVGRGAHQNAGIVAAVQGTDWSIGYVEWIYAVQSHLSFGSVRNSSGKFVTATLDSIGAAVSAANAAMAYPITSFTYLLVPAVGQDPEKSKAMRELLQWIFTSGQNQAAGLGYVALSPDTAAKGAKAAASIR
jgi:phosphate transport system substrate-binding protein